jgi:hypothetical protein
MTTIEATAKFQAGQITTSELAEILTANAAAQVEAENIARHGTADSITIITDIRAGR